MSDNVTPDLQQIATKRRSKNKLWLFLGVALIIIIGISGATITPTILQNIEKARYVQCKKNLNLLICALKQYAMDYADRFPNGDDMAGLNKLQQGEYMTDYSFCYCPSAKTKTVNGKLSDKNISYVYFGGFMDTSNDCKGHSPENRLPFCPVPVLFDRPGNHNYYINYTDEDGQIQTLQSKAQDCSGFIEDMNTKFKYHPEILKILRAKAAEADRRYSKEK